MTTKFDTDDKLYELENRIINLEESYDRDIKSILEILRKMETKIAGGGLDSDEIGLIMEIRDLKREMSDNKSQLQAIEKNVEEIKNCIEDNKQLSTDVAELKLKIQKHDKFKWLILGGAITIGWIVGNLSNIIGVIKVIF